MSDLRKALVEEIRTGERSIAAICRDYGVSRHTAYKWLARYDSGGDMEGLSRAPNHSPTQTPPEIENLIIQARQEHPCWGGRKLKAHLERTLGTSFPAPSTITAILHRHKLISPEASRAATPYKRFEMQNPNDLWQTDFKGHFLMLDGTRCHPLTVIDDHSRYSLCISAKPNERFAGVHASFMALFRQYGLPLAILCDNGNPWGWGGLTRFDILLMDYGVLPMHGRPFHPQTQGKDERFNRTLKEELLLRDSFENLVVAQAKFDAYRNDYNEFRPHCSLNLAVPADRYRKSERTMPEHIQTWEYPENAVIRTVTMHYIRFKNIRIPFSEAFNGLQIALESTPEDGIMDVIYRNFRVAKINLREKKVISRKIGRVAKYL